MRESDEKDKDRGFYHKNNKVKKNMEEVNENDCDSAKKQKRLWRKT